jgi:hypothetical protein
MAYTETSWWHRIFEVRTSMCQTRNMLTLFALCIAVVSCNKDEGNNPIPDLTALKFKRINVYQGDELIRYFEPEYHADGKIKRLILVNLSPSEKYIDTVTFDARSIKIRFFQTSVPYAARPYRDVIFYHANGRLDSIIYNDILTVPPISPLIRKHVFEYNPDNRISREYDFYFFENDTAGIVEYKNHQVVNGRLVSVERFGPDENYEKLEYTYSTNKEWNTNGFNLLNFFYLPVRLLFVDDVYLAPLFFNDINFKGNTDANAVITQERLSGYFFFDGVKNEYDRIRSMDYVFDDKGRITEMNSMQAFSNRIKFEYFD